MGPAAVHFACCLLKEVCANTARIQTRLLGTQMAHIAELVTVVRHRSDPSDCTVGSHVRPAKVPYEMISLSASMNPGAMQGTREDPS